VKSLNEDFAYIKIKLQEYLTTIDATSKQIIPDINNHFKTKFHKANRNEKIVFLNFNYTSTVEMYCKHIEHNQYEINYIHGKLNDETNPIIFGYGDEIDSYYQKIEDANNNEYLRNFKSFGYYKTNNYQNLSKLTDYESHFDVFIMGHSCGLSDRVLLNRILENDFCHHINIYYYKINDNENDYAQKTMELSRHFTSKSRHKMRTKIQSFPDSVPLVGEK
jgi:hypothetical protein